jgi:hypothetical protein
MIVAVTLAAPAYAGDEVAPLVEKGRKAYEAGDYQAALGYFQQVVQLIQASLSQSFERFFPEPLSGWTADEIESHSWSGTSQDGTQNMTNLSRDYQRESDGIGCTITFSNWPQMIQGLKQSVSMYKQMGEMMNQDPNMQVSVDERDGWTVLKVVEIESEQTQITALADDMMITIDLETSESGIADEYFARIDLKGIGGK